MTPSPDADRSAGAELSASAFGDDDTAPPAGAAWFVVDGPITAPGQVRLTGQEGRHAATVRRIRPGERVVLTDGAGTWWPAETVAVDARAGELTAAAGQGRRVPQARPRVTVVQAIGKGDSAEQAVDLLTQAGVDAIIPWQAARCVARWSGPKVQRGVQRWRSAARAAGKQSRRAWIPPVREPATTERVAALLATADLACVLHEGGGAALSSLELPTQGEIVLVVGPEGGIAPGELEGFVAAGAAVTRLGPQVIRSAAAGALALAALGPPSGRW